MRQETPGRAAEWRAHWKLALAAFAGFSLPSLAVNAMGVFVAPLHAEFGWNRTEIMAGVTLVGLLTVPLAPVIGGLVDRFGARRLAIPGILAVGLTLAGLSLANGEFWQWLMLWTLFGIATLFVGTTLWTSAISNVFHAGRAMALAVTLCGTAFAGTMAPIVSHWLIEGFGWRKALMFLGLGWTVPVLLLVVLFFYDRHDRARRDLRAGVVTTETPAVDLPGLSVAEAVRSVPLWRIGIATMIVLGLDVAILVQKVPIMTEAGLTRGTAAYLAGMSAAAAIVGKLVTGWLLDRFDAGVITSSTMVIAAVGYALLLLPLGSAPLMAAAMFLIGYAGGTKMHICTYLTGIYAGMRNFGKIFGVMASVIALAAGLGPLLSGVLYDLTGSYTSLLISGSLGCLVASVMLLRLGQPAWKAAAA